MTVIFRFSRETSPCDEKMLEVVTENSAYSVSECYEQIREKKHFADIVRRSLIKEDSWKKYHGGEFYGQVSVEKV